MQVEGLEPMDFGKAIRCLKEGNRVAREGWNGKGMFLYYVPANKYPYTTSIGESIADADGNVEYGAYIAMKTAQGNVVPWLASQTDVLAEDWVLLYHPLSIVPQSEVPQREEYLNK